jgi:hypothetical protein
VDGHARTSTELSVVAEVSPSTTSVHLGRLKRGNIASTVGPGPDVARVPEGLVRRLRRSRDGSFSGPIGRAATLDEVAGVVAFLPSEHRPI